VAPGASAAPAPPPRTASTSAALEAVRAVPGVSHAVVLTRDGRGVAGGGYEAEQLTGLSVYLAMTAAELGAAFQAGDLRFAAVQGQRQHLLLFVTKSHYLGVFARPDAELGAVDAGIRAALSVGR
jgi:predicted regulator of Ras-like GTPase activity (Roadblock/LC7/MglB family)